ncbi:hypothetical protein [Leptodesmis sp.]|uniref:hypothetical protein n=1 Tax=Leptodesmis sp. TaxID=3100501 RepID=UPI004053533C
MQLFNTAATTPFTDSSSLNPNASALLSPQAAYGFSDSLQQMRRASCNTSAKAGAYHADFDGNSMTDLLWYNNQTGELRAWLMKGADVPTVAYTALLLQALAGLCKAMETLMVTAKPICSGRT